MGGQRASAHRSREPVGKGATLKWRMDEKAGSVYANVVQVSRTPWDVNLYFLKAVIPRDKPGEIDLLKTSELVSTVTLPVAVAEKLAKILKGVVELNVVEVESPDVSNR